MTTTRNFPIMPAISDEYVAFPFHYMVIESRKCLFCNEEPIWATYAEYLDHYAANYEGSWLSGPYDPQTEERFDYFASTCLGLDGLSTTQGHDWRHWQDDSSD